MNQDLTPDFQLVFNTMPGNFLVLKPDVPHFTILAVSDELLKLANLERHSVIGRSIFEVFPENPEAVTATGPSNLRKSLTSAVETKQSDQMPVIRYDVPNAEGVFEKRYWSSFNKPILNKDGDILYLLHATKEVTDDVKAEEKVIELEKVESTYSLFMQAPVAVCIVNGPENLVRLANEEMLQVLGNTSEIIGKPLFEVIPEAIPQGFPELLDQVRSTGTQVSATEYPITLHIDGEEELRYYNFVYQPYFEKSSDPEASGVFSVAHEVTEQVLARKRVEETEYRYRTLIEEAPIATALYIGKEIRIQYANDIMLSYWGKDCSVTGKTLREALPELEGQPFPDLLDRVYATGVAYSGVKEKANLFIDGRLQSFYFTYTYKPLFDVAGILYGIHQTAIDVTEEVLAQRKLEENKEELNKLANAMPQLVWIADADGEVTYYNDRISEFAGATKLPNGTWRWEGILFPDDVMATSNAWNKAVAEASVYEQEHRLQMKDGAYRWYLSRALPQLNKAGNVLKWYGTATDVQRQKEYEEALRQSEARLQAIIEATPECIKIVSEDGTLQFINHSGLEMIEGNKELLGTACVFDIIDPEYKKEWQRNHKRVCNGESLSWEFNIIGLNGARRRMETHAVPLSTAEGVMHLGVTRDVTERKKSEIALRESEEQFRTFANNVQNLAWMAEPDGWIYWYNQRWYEYTGTTLEEMLGWGWAKVHHPDHVDSVVAHLKETWEKGETWELTFPLRGADGAYRWFLTRAHAVKDTHGKVVRWIGTNTNIDNQKKAEAALELKNKELTYINNDLDNFVYAASHDLKAPIANIEGLLAFLSDDLSQGILQENDAKHVMSLMQGSVNRFKKTINNLNDVVKLQQENKVSPVLVSLPEVVQEVIQDLEPMIQSSGVQLTIDVSECSTIHFSEKNLRSIIYNLLSNAIKYRSPEREALVEVHCQTAATHHVITVKDNGLGMKENHMGQLFTMFKRFHDHVEGSGIGLYMVKKMVENAGGHIEVESQIDVGSTFRVFLKR
ncbi:PAS domain-containing protein [Pontibacter locisalis]|uniref:histidine kinase n=1 Tax=Pontibacter locisalis TaxID=1719035 RepID=A0ABW5IM88_9BACT